MENSFTSLLSKQRAYYQSGITRSYAFRIEQLKMVRAAIKKHETLLLEALHADLNKSNHESYSTEIGPALSELRFIKNHLYEWMQPRHVPGMIFSFYSEGKIISEPYGTALIISPWNYPFWLSVVPLIGAIAAGNCAILKPSEVSPHTSAAIKKMLDETFPDEFIAVMEGDSETAWQLIELPPDYIFFTGSTKTGKTVAEAAAKNLIPVTLELGGKSPCIIDETSDMKLTAKRVMWGKLITAGQTCVAPDYLLIHESKKDEFVDQAKKVLEDFYPGGSLNDDDYPCIINEEHFQRLKNLMRDGKILLGGKADDARRKIEPTLLSEVNWEHAIMKEEIFGPLLPIITFNSLNEVIEIIQHQPKPLAFYIFSNNKKFRERLLHEASYGGALINDTIEHLGNHYLPFGGIGASGIGTYHGQHSFDTFTHYKAVMRKATWLDMPFRYKPFTKWKEWIMRAFLR